MLVQVQESKIMPTTAQHLQKRFKLTIVDGLSQEAVEVLGAGHWLSCCPLCGCTHQVLGMDESVPYTSRCQTQHALFKAELEVWRKQYPEVGQHKELRLVGNAA
jgi:hypothetical protein